MVIVNLAREAALRHIYYFFVAHTSLGVCEAGSLKGCQLLLLRAVKIQRTLPVGAFPTEYQLLVDSEHFRRFISVRNQTRYSLSVSSIHSQTHSNSHLKKRQS
jgi:hypothetical protein